MKYLILDENKNVHSWGDYTNTPPHIKEGHSLVSLTSLQYAVYDACRGDLKEAELAILKLKSITNFKAMR